MNCRVGLWALLPPSREGPERALRNGMTPTGVKQVTEHFADRLRAAIKARGGPICVGLDPVLEKLPEDLRQSRNRVDAVHAFSLEVIEAVRDEVPCVKVQSACFERYGAAGVTAYEAVIDAARKAGLMIIADVKRADIGISSEHYAVGLLGDADTGPDAVTINPYLGTDAIQPFIDHAREHGKGLFNLVRTSNPGSDEIQDLLLEDGRTVSEAVAWMVDRMGGQEGLRSEATGDSLMGAVVGATKADEARNLRELMPEQTFLVPGFGAQGGSAEDVKACFRDDGSGAIVTASRSVIYAWHDRADELGDAWPDAVRDAAKQMKEQINAVVQKRIDAAEHAQ